MEHLNQILLVEDESAIADSVLYTFEKEGFKVTWCQTASAAEEALARSSFSLIILDVGLPDKRGFDLCRDVRKLYSTPIIFLTARDEEVDRIVGFELGADDYVTKPFSPRELAARVRAVLRRAGVSSIAASKNTTATQDQQELNATAKSGKANSKSPFQIDSNRHLITFYGQELDLSRYEYQLLAVLISRPGWVFSREQLMLKVWDDPNSSMERTVDAHIKSIRSALRKIEPDLEVIITHRGIGYSLREQW